MQQQSIHQTSATSRKSIQLFPLKRIHLTGDKQQLFDKQLFKAKQQLNWRDFDFLPPSSLLSLTSFMFFKESQVKKAYNNIVYSTIIITAEYISCSTRRALNKKNNKQFHEAAINQVTYSLSSLPSFSRVVSN